MPLYMTSFILPASAGVPYVLEDKYIRGGYRCVATLAERDAIRSTEKKAGMRVYVAEDTKIYTVLPGALTTWVEVVTGPTRQTAQFVAPSALANNATVDFTLPLGKSAMILALSASAAGIEIQCHSTSARNDANPYTFLSYAGHLSDDGSSKLDDDSIEYGRRYSMVSNLSVTPTSDTYWRIINKSGGSLTPTINVTYLTVE